MNTQPEVLRTLNEKFTSGNGIEVERTTITRDEYLELRRLHEVNQELVEALEQITKVEYQSPVTMYQAMEDIAKAALAKERGTE
jgi:hypothetical protein